MIKHSICSVKQTLLYSTAHRASVCCRPTFALPSQRQAVCLSIQKKHNSKWESVFSRACDTLTPFSCDHRISRANLNRCSRRIVRLAETWLWLAICTRNPHRKVEKRNIAMLTRNLGMLRNIAAGRILIHFRCRCCALRNKIRCLSEPAPKSG